MMSTPVLVLLNFSTPQKGISWHSSQLVHQSFLSCCCRCFSKILMSQKYHNIKNKCNPFTKQWAINNNQVVFLYCICTVYTESEVCCIYVHKTTGSLMSDWVFSIAYDWNPCPDSMNSRKIKRQQNNLRRILESRRDNAQCFLSFLPPKKEALVWKGK